ncbi:repressor LexA [Parageobacillus thermantarcticus]|uniref:Repressor LexA n=1 Tax=Parageobacillus thermantarcticus TaxID=186116 RepID=A0A1I0TYQ5_9BACL|nr:transcriptional repressor LexA [Parageobacillus thermantarcticus]SFA56904.1 repressor LexA [Parageobacillus thermantarcticus]
MHIGQKIKQLRKAHKLTQEELAKILDVKPTAVSAWELGRNKPLMDKLDMIAHYFGVPISYFFEENEIKGPKNHIYFVKLPIVGTISCGNGVIAYEDIEGYEEVPRSWLNGGEYFFLRAKGDSMINARIMDGDLLMIRRQDDVENGDIAAVLIDGEAVLKRVYKSDDTIILQSENPAYKPIILRKDDMKNIRIIGKLKKVVLNF